MNRYALYEAAVQTPETDVDRIETLFEARRGRTPLSLREDFAGTALFSVTWVLSDDDRTATAVDHDAEALAYGRAAHVADLDEDEAARVTLRRADVRELLDHEVDVIAAMNFSWACFEDDADLGAYLGAAARGLADDGLLVLEVFGGDDLRRPLTHVHPMDGFVYRWEHLSYDPGAEVLEAAIHFEVDDARLDRAFTYRFRLRDQAKLRALGREHGFSAAELWAENPDGTLVRATSTPEGAAWSGYLVFFR